MGQGCSTFDPLLQAIFTLGFLLKQKVAAPLGRPWKKHWAQGSTFVCWVPLWGMQQSWVFSINLCQESCTLKEQCGYNLKYFCLLCCTDTCFNRIRNATQSLWNLPRISLCDPELATAACLGGVRPRFTHFARTCPWGVLWASSSKKRWKGSRAAFLLWAWQSLRSQSPRGCAQLPSTEEWGCRASPATAVAGVLSRLCREAWYTRSQCVNLRKSRKQMLGRFHLWRLACQIYFEEAGVVFQKQVPKLFQDSQILGRLKDLFSQHPLLWFTHNCVNMSLEYLST